MRPRRHDACDSRGRGIGGTGYAVRVVGVATEALPDRDEFFYLKPPFVVVVAEETQRIVVFDLGVVRPCEVDRLIVDCRRDESSRARWGCGALSARGIGLSPTVQR